MDLSHITSHSLRRILILTERKDELVDLVAEIETEIARVIFPDAAAPTSRFAKKPAPVRKERKPSVPRKAAKGAPLRVRIPEMLGVAGPKGIRVRDIAANLGISSSRAAVWLCTTGKKLVKRVAPGVYALKGSRAAAAAPAKSVPTHQSPQLRKKLPVAVKKASKRSKRKGKTS